MKVKPSASGGCSVFAGQLKVELGVKRGQTYRSGVEGAAGFLQSPVCETQGVVMEDGAAIQRQACRVVWEAGGEIDRSTRRGCLTFDPLRK